MTSLILDRLWINRLDTGEAIAAYTAEGSRSQQYTAEVETRAYAGGRRRSIGTAGEDGAIAFQLVLLSLATTELLRSWKGLAVQVRDHRGQKRFGTIPSVEVVEYKEPGLYAATVSLDVNTVDEGV